MTRFAALWLVTAVVTAPAFGLELYQDRFGDP